jgi:DNA-binding transcriptional ArsR family regulator
VDPERELLAALRDRGEMTPAGVAVETSLSVDEADRRLRELAEAGHLEVRVRGGGIFYALWETEALGIEGVR